MHKSTVRLHPITGEPLKPVGFVRGKAVWPILGGSESAGTEGGGEGNPPSGEPPKSGSNEGGGEKQLPQSKVNEIVAAETAKAKKKVMDDLQTTLGVSPEEAAQIVKAYKEREDSEKTEAQRAREAADAEKAEAEKAKQEAAREIFATRADRALIKAGASAEDDDLERLRGMLKVTVDSSVEDIAKDVKALAEKFPALFAASGQPPRPSNDPKKTPTPPKADTDAYARGLERAKGSGQSREYPKPPGVPA